MASNAHPEQVRIQQDHEPQAEDADNNPAQRDMPAAHPLQDQQVVSDDGLERHPHPGDFFVHAPPFLPHQQQAMAMAQYYEARMRDHAAAYASAAAGAA
ncbi:hypothetical protein MHU86_1468 [Fragilaria crotonensis]|nr:hypothetical protein MHU86_1468 [Fragilaria crotonensis]